MRVASLRESQISKFFQTNTNLLKTSPDEALLEAARSIIYDTVSKSNLFEAHAAFPRFFPAICGKNHVLCKLWQSDWSIPLLAAVPPFAKTKCKTLPLRRWECGRSSYFILETDQTCRPPTTRKKRVRFNWPKLKFYDPPTIIFVNGNISSPWKHLSLQVE